MKFGRIATKDALGAYLAHSAELPGGRMRKGKALTSQDISRLEAAGHPWIVAAVLDENDLHEDPAAQQLAAALVQEGSGLKVSTAATGRVNVTAETSGVFCFDPAAALRVNTVNPMVTVATLAPFQRVQKGDIVATVKIISYGVAAADVAEASGVAGPFTIKPAVHRDVTLIETHIGDAPPSPKGRTAMATRLDRFGCKLTPRIIVPHTENAIQTAIGQATGTVVMILTASATSDAYDVAPQAVRLAGGTITRFGMPVDPGNLLFLGEFNAKPVIGLPGCARSLAMNGADWIVDRTLCGVSISDSDIAAMGVGGLLKESPARNHPRAKAPR